MLNSETKNNSKSVCNLNYLSELMGGKNHLIKKIIGTFLTQVPKELKSINHAIAEVDYTTIKNIAHTMKSSVSIMEISTVLPVLQEMEDLGVKGTSIERIIVLNHQLNFICKQAFEEITNYSFSQ